MTEIENGLKCITITDIASGAQARAWQVMLPSEGAPDTEPAWMYSFNPADTESFRTLRGVIQLHENILSHVQLTGEFPTKKDQESSHAVFSGQFLGSMEETEKFLDKIQDSGKESDFVDLYGSNRIIILNTKTNAHAEWVLQKGRTEVNLGSFIPADGLRDLAELPSDTRARHERMLSSAGPTILPDQPGNAKESV